MRISELAALHRGTRADFTSSYPAAALVIRRSSLAKDPGYSTATLKAGSTTRRDMEVDNIARIEITNEIAAETMKSNDSEDCGRYELVFLVKTPRNPFKNMITIGRAPNNDVCLEHPTISKMHLAFVHEGGYWKLLDPGSTNGTFLDGDRVPPSRPVPIFDGAWIRIGTMVSVQFVTSSKLYDMLERHRAAKVA